ncbi:hypothetical protein [Paenibacillus taiwanensis]|uniref:hypothetical protein n=1 Tax=Paenibacillus taiwanensis TaxID=401638 RepID=UPI00048F0976|nr:hypothetical protein [Paenibacillus taiwanensis]
MPSKYIKPICDCGAELFFTREEGQVMTYKILKNGMLAKRPVHKGVEFNANHGYLICLQCRKEYEYNASYFGEHKWKALRGDEI